MRKPLALWATISAFGLVLWLSSVGAGTHPAYRLVLMVAMLSWCAWFIAAPELRGQQSGRVGVTAVRRFGVVRGLVVLTKALFISVALVYLAEYHGDASCSRGRWRRL